MKKPAGVAVLAMLLLSLTCLAQQPLDPIVTWQQTQQRLLADLDHMPRYTCVENITRTYYDAKSASHGSSCSAFIAAQARRHNAPPFGWDRLRLEVAWVDGRNLYAWAGEPAFANDNLELLANDGPLGSGDFGVVLREILLRATIDFQREQGRDGQRLLEYSYDMPLEKSTYSIRTANGWARVAHSGALLIDPARLDLVRLTMRIMGLPLSSSACQAANEITYGRVSIHGSLVLIPRETRLDVINTSGTESLGQTAFANCREYKSTSRLVLNPSRDAGGPQAAPANAAPTPLPAGLAFEARVITPIDSDTAAAGDPIEAVLRSVIRDKDKKVIASPGARIHGRLTGVRWRSKPDLNQQIALRFESMEIDGRDVPFNAILEPPHPKVLTGTVTSPSQMAPLKPAGPLLGGIFSFRRHHVYLKNLDARWITTAPATMNAQ